MNLRQGSLDTKADIDTVEDVSSRHETADAAGTIHLYQDGSVVLVPTPSPDPKDPLNLPSWRKYLIILIVGLYSAMAVLGTSGLGSVYPEVQKLYPNDDPARVSDLLTYPTLFMGIGNLLSMPLATAIGRRPVFLLSLVLLAASGIWCACSTKSLGSHIAGRDVFSMAAGQSEALAPLMVQEIHFIHEHGAKLSYFIGVQTSVTAAFFLATTYLVPAIGLEWWYGVITIINGLLLILSFLFLAESYFERPKDAEEGAVHYKLDKNGNVSRHGTQEGVFRVTTHQDGYLEPEKYGERTWNYDLKLFHMKPNWGALISFYVDTFKALAVPPVTWMLLLNGAFLGVYIYQASTFANVLVAPPYNFKTEYLGYVQLIQVLDCVLLVPILGFGSDFLCKWLSRRNKGRFEPEYRLIVVVIPVSAAIISCVIFGHAAASPYNWPWISVVASYHLGYFSFLAVNLVGITWAMDSFPSKSAPLLLVICAGRGFISFGLSYSTVPLINKIGYNGALNIFAIITGVLGGLGFIMYFVGKRVRIWVQKSIWPKQHEE